MRRRSSPHAGRPLRRQARQPSSRRRQGADPWLPRAGSRVGAGALLAALALALGFSVPGLRAVIGKVDHLNPVWLVVAVALKLASELSFVVVFRLFFDRLPGPLARKLAWTALASGVLLPGGGAGGLAIGGWLVHLAGAPKRWIVTRSGGLFFLTTAVNTAALVSSGLVLFAGVHGPHGLATVVLPTALALALTLPLVSLPAILRSRPNAPSLLRLISAGIQDAGRTAFTRRPSWRLIGAVGYLGFDVAVLWVTLAALGHAPSVPTLILAYNIGHLAKLLPVPGGIGTLDAGLTGALVLYGVSPAHAAAAVLIYHVIALWIPGLGGLLAYLRLRPRLTRAARAAGAPALMNAAIPSAEGRAA